MSEGKPLVTVPNFIFLTVAEARAKAEELGLELDLSQRWIFSGPVKDDKIISDQREEPSTQVEVGTTIHLVYDAKELLVVDVQVLERRLGALRQEL